MQERRFHYFCTSQNLVFKLVTKHVFSIVNIIQTINWKPNWIGDFILPVSDSQRLGGGREDFIISWAWAHDVLLMLKRLMQSLQSTCTWKYWVGVERWHYLCTWHQYIVIKVTYCSEKPSKNWMGSGKIWENNQTPGKKRYYGERPRHQFVYFTIYFFLWAIWLIHKRTTLNLRYCSHEVTVNGIKLHLCFYPYYSRKTYLRWLLVDVFKWCLHSLSLANMQQHLCPALSVCVGGLVTAWLFSVIICPFPATSLVHFDTLTGISCYVLLLSFSAFLFLSSQKLPPLKKFLPHFVKISTI